MHKTKLQISTDSMSAKASSPSVPCMVQTALSVLHRRTGETKS